MELRIVQHRIPFLSAGAVFVLHFFVASINHTQFFFTYFSAWFKNTFGILVNGFHYMRQCKSSINAELG